MRITWLVAFGTASCGNLSMARQPANPATERLLALTENINPGDMVQVCGLLNDGPDVNAEGNDGNTAPVPASWNGHLGIVKSPIGASINSEGESDCAALLRASENGNTETVKLLLEANTGVNCPTSGAVTPLMMASQNGHTKIVELFIDAGAKVNTECYGGVTALLMASWNGHTEIVRMLLDADANANVATSGPQLTGRPYQVPFYRHFGLKATAQSTPLILASHNGYSEIVKLLLEAGADVNDKSFDSATALILASRNGHTKVVKLLLNAGANVNAALSTSRNYYSRIRPGIAVDNRLTERERNIHDYLKTMGKSTSLILASQNGHTEIVKLLLEAGAKVNVVTSNDHTALSLALQNGHTEIVKLLKEFGAKE